MLSAQPPTSNTLLVTNLSDSSRYGGRELLYKVNFDCLSEILGEGLTVFELNPSKAHGLRNMCTSTLGYIDGVTPKVISEILEIIKNREISRVFIDGTNLGRLAQAIRIDLPQVEILSFAHNVEARFFWGAFLRKKSSRALAITCANYIAERKAVKYSDKLICLSERDSDMFFKLYGRHATNIMPMALSDSLNTEINAPIRTEGKYLLFVGGDFYANVAGIEWFAEYVAPNILTKTYIVGRGLGKYKDKFSHYKNIHIIGEVDDLSDWYRRAHLVIAPIFDGSGMKTKVAEALMFGKRIVGTKEAFSGYENVAETAGWLCNSASEFINVINTEHHSDFPAFDSNLRALFESKYSYEASLKNFRNILLPMYNKNGEVSRNA